MGLDLMSSWDWESKFLIFWGVGGIKFEFWWAGKLIFWEGGGIKFEFWWGGFNCADWTVHLSRLSNHNVPPGPSDNLYENEAEGRV